MPLFKVYLMIPYIFKQHVGNPKNDSIHDLRSTMKCFGLMICNIHYRYHKTIPRQTVIFLFKVFIPSESHTGPCLEDTT